MKEETIITDKVFQLGKFFGWHSDGGISIAYCGFNDFSAKNTISNPPRMDHYLTIHLVVEGKGTFFVNGNKYYVKKGDMFFLFPNTTVSYYPNKKEPWKYYWLNIDGPQVQGYISMLNLSPARAVVACPEFEKIKKEFEHILDPKLNFRSSNFYSIALFYTNILNAGGPVLLFDKYGTMDTWTVGYLMFYKVMMTKEYNLVSAMGLYLTIIIVPLVMGARKLIEKIPSVEY